jgi:hypothetical protein
MTYEDQFTLRDGYVVGISRKGAAGSTAVRKLCRQSLLLVYRPVRRVTLSVRVCELRGPGAGKASHDSYLLCSPVLPSMEALSLACKTPAATAAAAGTAGTAAAAAAATASPAPAEHWDFNGCAGQSHVTQTLCGVGSEGVSARLLREMVSPDDPSANRFTDPLTGSRPQGMPLAEMERASASDLEVALRGSTHLPCAGRATAMATCLVTRIPRSTVDSARFLVTATLNATRLVDVDAGPLPPGFRPVYPRAPAAARAIEADTGEPSVRAGDASVMGRATPELHPEARRRLLCDDSLDAAGVMRALHEKGCVGRGAGETDIEYTMRVRDAIRRALKYDLKANNRLNAGKTPSSALRNGVAICHTFSLCLVAALRAGGVPARYVSCLPASCSIELDLETLATNTLAGETEGLGRQDQLDRARRRRRKRRAKASRAAAAAAVRVRKGSAGAPSNAGSAKGRSGSAEEMRVSALLGAIRSAIREAVSEVDGCSNPSQRQRVASHLALNLARAGGPWWSGLRGCGVDAEIVEAATDTDSAASLVRLRAHPNSARLLAAADSASAPAASTASAATAAPAASSAAMSPDALEAVRAAVWCLRAGLLDPTHMSAVAGMKALPAGPVGVPASVRATRRAPVSEAEVVGRAGSTMAVLAERQSAKFSLQHTHATVDCWIEGVGWCSVEPQSFSSDLPVGTSRGSELVVGYGDVVTRAIRADAGLLRGHFGDTIKLLRHSLKEFDRDGDGHLSLAELGRFTASAMGRPAPASKAEAMSLGRAVAERHGSLPALVGPEELIGVSKGPAGAAFAHLLGWRLGPSAIPLNVWGASMSDSDPGDGGDPRSVFRLCSQRGGSSKSNIESLATKFPSQAAVLLESECVHDCKLD